MELRQAVDRAREQVRPRMLEPVPGRVVGGRVEAEVGTEVDDGGTAFQDPGHEASGGTVREREEDGVGVIRDVALDREVRAREVRLAPREGLTLAVAAHDAGDSNE